MALDKALASAKAGQTAEILKHLLTAWRKQPAIVLNEAIAEVARLAEAEEAPLLGKTAAEVRPHGRSAPGRSGPRRSACCSRRCSTRRARPRRRAG